jgi:hypothetical protein
MQTLNLFVQTLATSFQLKTRDNGETYYCAKDNAPYYISDLCHEAHNDMMPDDYRYEYLVEALEHIDSTLDPLADNLDDIEAHDACEPDCMSHDLLRWVSSNLSRMGYCDDVLYEYQLDQLSDVLIQAQQAERVEVMQAVINWIESQQGVLWDVE